MDRKATTELSCDLSKVPLKYHVTYSSVMRFSGPVSLLFYGNNCGAYVFVDDSGDPLTKYGSNSVFTKYNSFLRYVVVSFLLPLSLLVPSAAPTISKPQ